MANLITRQQYKIYTKMDHSKDDSKIDTLVESVSQMVKTYCGHAIIDYYSATKTELFDVDVPDLPRTAPPGDHDQLVSWDINIDLLEIVHPGTPDANALPCRISFCLARFVSSGS